MAESNRKVSSWVTVNGKHVPVYEGESKSDATSRAVSKSSKDNKEKPTAGYQKKIDKLNNLKIGKRTYTHK